VSGGRYAAGTDVPQDRSRAELERVLQRYGATGFAYAWSTDTTPAATLVEFVVRGRRVRLTVPLPDRSEYSSTPTGLRRTDSATDSAHAQAVRARWRAVVLIVKAKLEAVDAGVVTFDEEWLPYLVTAGGQTVAQVLAPQLDAGLSAGHLALPTGGDHR
jgi:hypothetical protein